MRIWQSSPWIASMLLALSYGGCNGSDSEPSGGSVGGTAAGGKIVIDIGSGGKAPATGGSTGGSEGEGWLEVCELGGGPSVGDPKGELAIDDFDDEESGFYGNGLQGGWFAYMDTSGGTQEPTGDNLPPSPGGLTESGKALHIRGGGHTEWGSGFGAIFASRGFGQECSFDATAYSGISFWAKGSVTSDETVAPDRPGLVRFRAVEKDVLPKMVGGNCPDGGSCYDSHGANFEVEECWQQFAFDFPELKTEGWGYPSGELDLDELFTFEFAIGQGQSYDLWIDDVSFYVGAKPTGSLDCGMGGMGGFGGSSP